MPYLCGVYGYHITKPIYLHGICIVPITTDHQLALKLARDLNSYHLTATIEIESVDDDYLMNLEATLSFIEHLDVIISQPIDIDNSDSNPQLQPVLRGHYRNNGGGAVVAEDTLFPTSRSIFIQKTMARLSDKEYCKNTQFNILLFKCVETFRLRLPFLDVSYFLLFSGIESYSRSLLNDKTNKNTSEPICKTLQKFGFDVKCDYPNDFHRSISTYTHLRNALFHNSEIEKNVRINNASVNLQLSDYSSNFAALVSLVILKAVEFDDNHINWNSWIDRMLFK